MESNKTASQVIIEEVPSQPLSSSQIAIYACVSIALIALSGLVAGLTLGLLSLDRLELEVVKRSGSSTKRKWAARVAPLLRNPHWLLVSLVLINAACNTSLPIFLDRLLSPAVAILLSTTAVLIFGEILPQAVCARHGIVIGGALSWVVKIILAITAPISWPIGRLLDWMLGPHEKPHGRRQLKALVTLHAKHEGLGGNLLDDEIKIIRGVLDLAGKDAAAAMTPLDRVFALPDDVVLNRRCMAAVLRTGRSRVPVWRHGPTGHPEFLGFLLTKEMLQRVDPARPVRAGALPMRKLPHLSAHTSLFDLLKFFSSGHSHMAVLTVPEREVSSLLRSLDGPASTSSTRGSDTSQDGNDHDSSSSGSDSSDSSSSTTSSSSSRSSSGVGMESSVIGGGPARSAGGSAPAEAAAGGRRVRDLHSGPFRGSVRWSIAEHRIRAVLRLVTGGGRRRHRERLERPDSEEAAATGDAVPARMSQPQGSVRAPAQLKESLHQHLTSEGMPGRRSITLLPQGSLGAADVPSGNGGGGGGGLAAALASGQQNHSLPGELQLSNMGSLAVRQLSRNAAAALQPEGPPDVDVDKGTSGAEAPATSAAAQHTALAGVGHGGPGASAHEVLLGGEEPGDVLGAGGEGHGFDVVSISSAPATSAAAAVHTPGPPPHHRRSRAAAHFGRAHHVPLRRVRAHEQAPGASGAEDAAPAVLLPGGGTAEAAATPELYPPGGAGEDTVDLRTVGEVGVQYPPHSVNWLHSAAAAAEVLVPVGIITLEDVIEELMQFEILDETDQAPPNGTDAASP